MRNKFLMLASVVALAPFAANAQGGLPTCTSTDARMAAKTPMVGSSEIAPTLLAFVDGACLDLSDLIEEVVPGEIWSLPTDALSLGNGSFQFSGLLNADPFVSFGVTTTNLTDGPVSYAFVFGTPVVPGLYSSATSTAGVTVTNGAGGSSSVMTSGFASTYVSGYGTAGSSATNLGVNLGSAPCTATGAAFSATNTCAQGTMTSTFAPTFYDNLEVLLTYNQTTASSVASWSGAVTLNAASTVPEPATFALVFSGIALVAGAQKARRRNAR